MFAPKVSYLSEPWAPLCQWRQEAPEVFWRPNVAQHAARTTKPVSSPKATKATVCKDVSLLIPYEFGSLCLASQRIQGGRNRKRQMCMETRVAVGPANTSISQGRLIPGASEIFILSLRATFLLSSAHSTILSKSPKGKPSSGPNVDISTHAFHAACIFEKKLLCLLMFSLCFLMISMKVVGGFVC